MPPKAKPKKSIFLMIVNVGATSKDLIDGEPFINKAKYAVKILLEKKIFLQPKDEFCILTMGEKTSDFDDVENIKVYNDQLLISNWDMIKYVHDLSSTDYTSNWIDALHASIQFLGKQDVDPDVIVFVAIFNNFKEDDEIVDQYDPNAIINELQNYSNLRILFVGEKDIQEIKKQKSLLKNSISSTEKFILKFIKNAEAQYTSINTFIETKQFFVAPSTKPVAWKFELEWGNLKIPCSSYVKLAETKKLGSWKMQAMVNSEIGESDKFVNVVKENIPVDIHRNEISPEKIINGYKFGGKYIPFSEEDEITMKFSGTSKGMKIYGFTSRNEVKLEYWSGTGSRIIVPATQKDSEAFYSLVQAMEENEYVAIVRKVYANNNLPKMGVLFPKMNRDDIKCLVHLEIPFANDIRVVTKRPIISLKKKSEYKEKLEAVENFIDSMIIREEESEYLSLGMFPNVRSQYHWNALAHRVFNLEGPLLLADNYLMKYLIPPEYARTNAKPHIEKLNKLFESYIIEKDLDKTKKIFPHTSRDNVDEENLNEPQKDRSKSQDNSQDLLGKDIAEFFLPEDLDFDMNEVDDM